MTSESPPPRRLVRETAPHDFRVFRVRRLVVADPRDDAEHPRVVIDAPEWVNVVAVTREGEVVLVRQFRFGAWANTLEIPGGMCDPGETPLESARRELEEETGYVSARWRPLGICHPNPAIQSNRTHTFLALDCEPAPSPLAPDAGEDLRVELAPRAEIPRLVRDGAITHALVLTAFLFDAWSGDAP